MAAKEPARAVKAIPMAIQASQVTPIVGVVPPAGTGGGLEVAGEAT